MLSLPPRSLRFSQSLPWLARCREFNAVASLSLNWHLHYLVLTAKRRPTPTPTTKSRTATINAMFQTKSAAPVWRRLTRLRPNKPLPGLLTLTLSQETLLVSNAPPSSPLASGKLLTRMIVLQVHFWPLTKIIAAARPRAAVETPTRALSQWPAPPRMFEGSSHSGLWILTQGVNG